MGADSLPTLEEGGWPEAATNVGRVSYANKVGADSLPPVEEGGWPEAATNVGWVSYANKVGVELPTGGPSRSARKPSLTRAVPCFIIIKFFIIK